MRFLLSILVLLLLGCGQEKESNYATVSFSFASKDLSGVENFGHVINNTTDFNCFGVMVEYPDGGNDNICSDLAYAEAFRAGEVVGTAAIGSEITANVRIASQVTFRLIGFKSTGGCPLLDQDATSAKETLSHPYHIGTTVADVTFATSEIDLVGSLANSTQLRYCQGPDMPWSIPTSSPTGFFYTSMYPVWVQGRANPTLSPVSSAGFFTFKASGLPTGLAIDNATGAITGTPTEAPGIGTASLTAMNFLGEVKATLKWAILNASSTFIVDSFADTPDTATGDNLCQDASLNCTLRAAMDELADNAPANYSIFIPSGTYSVGTDLPNYAHQNAQIHGEGQDLTIIDGNNVSNLFLLSGNGNAVVSNMTVQNAHSSANDGAALAYTPSGSIDVNNVTFQNNKVSGAQNGGAVRIFIPGGFIANFNYCKFISNSAIGNGLDTTGQGGAIMHQLGTVRIADSYFAQNSAQKGGAIFSTPMSADVISLASTTLALNTASVSGGGALFIFGDTTINASHTTFYQNSAAGDGGAITTYGPANTNAHTLFNVTIVGNSTASASGGGALYLGSTHSHTFTNIILADNTASGVGDNCLDAGASSKASNGGSLYSGDPVTDGCIGALAGSDLQGISASDVLGAFQTNGGYSPTLLPLGAAIDHGIAGCSSFDPTGYQHIDTLCDAGATEARDVQ